MRDVTFDEDRCRIRKGAGAQEMAALRNLAISLLRMAGARYIDSALRACSRRGQNALRLVGLEVKRLTVLLHANELHYFNFYD